MPDMRYPTPEGTAWGSFSEEGDRSALGSYWNAVGSWVHTGSTDALNKLDVDHVMDAAGNRIPLVRDEETLRMLYEAGELDFDFIYDFGGI